MKEYSLDEIRKFAEEELSQEILRIAIDKMKEQLKKKKWFHRFFPWRIVILRRDV